MINNSQTLTRILNAAQEDKYVLLNGTNGSLKVEAVGELPESGRRVKWVRTVEAGSTSAAEIDAHNIFSAEMQAAFGHKIGSMALEKFDPATSTRKEVLSSDEIKAAVLRAKEIQSLYEGIMLPTRLEFSATRKTPQFVACCNELGVQPSDLPTETVDILLDKALSNYCAENGPLIDHETSCHLLKETIKSLSPEL